jgi:hypothetical protein
MKRSKSADPEPAARCPSRRRRASTPSTGNRNSTRTGSSAGIARYQHLRAGAIRMCVSWRLRVRVRSAAFCRRSVSTSRSAKKTRSGSPSLPSSNSCRVTSRHRCQYSNGDRPVTQRVQLQCSLNDVADDPTMAVGNGASRRPLARILFGPVFGDRARVGREAIAGAWRRWPYGRLAFEQDLVARQASTPASCQQHLPPPQQ